MKDLLRDMRDQQKQQMREMLERTGQGGTSSPPTPSQPTALPGWGWSPTILAAPVMSAEERALYNSHPELWGQKRKLINNVLKLRHMERRSRSTLMLMGFLVALVLGPMVGILGGGVICAVDTGAFSGPSYTSAEMACMDGLNPRLIVLAIGAFGWLAVWGSRRRVGMQREYERRLENLPLAALVAETQDAMRAWELEQQLAHERYRDERLARSIGEEVARNLGRSQ